MMKHIYLQWFKKVFFLVHLCFFIIIFSKEVYRATNNEVVPHIDKAVLNLEANELKDIIISFYKQVKIQGIEQKLPEQFLLCYALLEDDAEQVTRENLVSALQSVINFVEDELARIKVCNVTPLDEERGPRPSSTQPVGPNNCCDLSEILKLLGIINSKLNTATVNISQAQICCSNLTATVIRDFNETWTILAALTTPTIVIDVDLSPVFTVLTPIQICCSNLTATVIRDFNETWTILAALTTPTVIVTIDLSPVFTVLKEIQDLEEVETHCPTVLEPSDILPNGYTITNPGYYTLCGSVGFDAPITASCVIRINASNVTLDLNQHTIYQTDADAGLVGICVNAGFDNIVIKSGKISGVTGDGITIANGSQDISISDVTVRSCGGVGISFSGTTGSRNRDVIIENSKFTNNSGNGGTFTFTEKVKISDSKFNDNVVIGASFTSSNGNEITNSTFNKNGGAGNAAGLSLNATGSSVIRNCVFNANFSTTGTARGLLLTSTGNLVENCVADGNSSTVSAGFAIGFDIDGAAHMLSDCSAIGNAALAGTGSIGVGFRLVSTAFGCLVRNGSALTNTARGFEHDALSSYNFFIGNISGGHGSDGTNYFGAGLGFLSVSGGMQITAFNENQRVNNISLT